MQLHKSFLVFFQYVKELYYQTITIANSSLWLALAPKNSILSLFSVAFFCFLTLLALFELIAFISVYCKLP